MPKVAFNHGGIAFGIKLYYDERECAKSPGGEHKGYFATTTWKYELGRYSKKAA